MNNAHEDAFFVDVGAYVGEFLKYCWRKEDCRKPWKVINDVGSHKEYTLLSRGH